MLFRYKIGIEYLGVGLVGWAKQHNGLSVQQILEDAIFQATKERTRVFGSGRTDSGVHATHQVAHFDLRKEEVDARKLLMSINHFVRPHLVGILSCERVTDPTSFDARFSATRRSYVYKILNRPACNALLRDRVYWVKAPQLNVDSMNAACAFLLGAHDFSAFRGASCGSGSGPRTLLLQASVRRGSDDEDIIEFHFSACSFLHHMVRNMVGALVKVGRGQWAAQDIKTLLESKERKGYIMSPPSGLYFLGPTYE